MKSVVPSDHLTVREAADEVGRTPETIRRWVWSGRLPCTRQRGRLLVTREDRMRFVTQQAALTLAEWSAGVAPAAAPGGGRGTRSAPDWVIADRRHRSAG